METYLEKRIAFWNEYPDEEAKIVYQILTRDRCSDKYRGMFLWNEHDCLLPIRVLTPLSFRWGELDVHTALRTGTMKILRLLFIELKRDCNARYQGSTPLFTAVRAGRADVVRFLLTLPGIDVSGHSYIGVACHLVDKVRVEDYIEIIQMFVERGHTPLVDHLQLAIQNCEDKRVVEHLLSYPSVDLSRDLWLTLFHTVNKERVEILKLLLSQPRVQTEHKNMALQSACSCKSLCSVKLLLLEKDVVPTRYHLLKATDRCPSAKEKQRLQIISLLLHEERIPIEERTQVLSQCTHIDLTELMTLAEEENAHQGGAFSGEKDEYLIELLSEYV